MRPDAQRSRNGQGSHARHQQSGDGKYVECMVLVEVINAAKHIPLGYTVRGRAKQARLGELYRAWCV